jgi:hypothetical protein
LARFKRFLDAVRAKKLLAGFVLNWNVGKTLADAASNEVLDVLILQMVDTYEVESGRVDIVVDFLVDAQGLRRANAEDSLLFYHLLT